MISLHYDNIRPSYYLKKWQYYEAAKYELSTIDLEDAKVFFNALKRLNEDDRKILADVYYYSKEKRSFNPKTGYYRTIQPVKDRELHEKYGVTVDKFGHMKRVAQMNLKKAMQEVLKQIGDEFVFRINSNLYLVRIIQEGTYKEQYVLGGASSARLFKPSDAIVMKLLLLGFEKIPVQEREIM